MKSRYLLSISLMFFVVFAKSQNYQFQKIENLAALPVISQDQTGTCWSYSTTSFIESEIIRLTGKKIDISEMYQVRETYPIKAENYVLRLGKTQFGEGGLAHDVINSIKKNGLVPLSAYTGLSSKNSQHNHAEMAAVIEAMLKVYVSNPAKKLSKKWKPAVNAVLDVYLGVPPTEFTYEGKTYTPKSFMAVTKINPDDYVTLTSFSNDDFYKSLILNIPDNFSNGSMYNLPLDEFVANIDHALAKGYTVALDCDVSEPTFSAKNGVAVMPANPDDNKAILTEIKPEMAVDQVIRQDEFENLNTQDDHLMHIVGKVKDQKGNEYYVVKNSWGSDSNRVANDGFIYMSVPYLKLKSISILLHKDGLNDQTKMKMAVK